MWNTSSGRAEILVWLAEPLLRAGVRAVLCAAGAGHIAVTEGARAVPGVVPDVVVTDWASGLRLARRDDFAGLPALGPRSRILALCAATRRHAISAGLRVGVHGVLLTGCTGEELVAAVRALARGSTYVCPELASPALSPGLRDELTAREEEVLSLMAQGQCNKTIARHLGIEVGTVKTHVKAVLSKLCASSRTQAVSIAAGLSGVGPGFLNGGSAGAYR